MSIAVMSRVCRQQTILKVIQDSCNKLIKVSNFKDLWGFFFFSQISTASHYTIWSLGSQIGYWVTSKHPMSIPATGCVTDSRNNVFKIKKQGLCHCKKLSCREHFMMLENRFNRYVFAKNTKQISSVTISLDKPLHQTVTLV